MGKSLPREYWPKLLAHSRRSVGSGFAPESLIRVRDGWSHLSITSPMGKRDEEERYTKALTPTGTNCGLNVVFAIGIRLQLGRIQRDVTSPQYLRSLHVPTQTFLHILAGPFGVAPQDRRDEAGAIMERSLENFDGAKFPRGQFVAVQAVLDILCYRVPQVTWNEVKTYTCCDGDPVVRLPRKEKSYSSLYVWLRQGEYVGECIQRHFKDSFYGKIDGVCTQGVRCNRVPLQRPRVLVDGSNPSRLIVHFDADSGISWGADEQGRLRVFENISLETWSLNGVFSNEYEVIGAIFVVNDNHFVLRWRAKDDSGKTTLLHFDDGKYTNINKWWDGYRRPEANNNLPRRQRVLQAEGRKIPEKVLTLIYQVL